MHVINPKKYLPNQLCYSADRRTNFFVCVSSDIRQITFAHNFLLHTDFPTAASIRAVMRCFVNLDQMV